MIKISPIPAFEDNYIWLLETPDGARAIVDPGDAAPVMEVLGDQNLDFIFLTHHHTDHTGGVLELKLRYQCHVYGAAKDAHRLPGVDSFIGEDARIPFGGEYADVFETPGHTLGHIGYHFAQSKALFCGDTLFSMGCGRLFEGTPDQMWESLNKICTLPEDTNIYCAHEYTLANSAFCQNIEPDNISIRARIKQAEKLRAENKPTLPVPLATEKATNVFLRADSAEKFAKIRRARDCF